MSSLTITILHWSVGRREESDDKMKSDKLSRLSEVRSEECESILSTLLLLSVSCHTDCHSKNYLGSLNITKFDDFSFPVLLL